jgi:hypothetical protein
MYLKHFGAKEKGVSTGKKIFLYTILILGSVFSAMSVIDSLISIFTGDKH